MPPKRPPPLEVAPVDRSREGVSITDTLTLVVRDEIGREMRVKDGVCVKDGVSHSPDAPVLNRIHYDDLRIGTVLGKGSQGKVRLVQHRQTKQIFAMKNIEYKGGSDAREARLALEAELRRVEALKHENIVTSHEAFFRSGQLCIILEYMDAGSLADVINRHVGGTPTAYLAYITRSLFRGLSHLHSQKVLHRDIKPANVLANSKAEIKITDFGISRSFSDQSLQTVTVFGSMPYLSPEMLQNEPYSFDCDVWSSGVTVAECALGKYPFNINKKGSVFEISETIVKGASAIDWSSIKEKHPDSLFDFIRLCLQPAKERPTSIQLMEHPFLKLADAASPADVGRWLVEGIPQKAPATK